ncbi:MAG: DUF366 family protein [Bdellovibrionaceae bacterium]|nr:DUF366 family protein [Pseudobdellovibrionaceae bacterium]MDW8190040.1 DUF366 family protein [Pseudobdellovibrionaceae bacterium]
MLKTLFLSENFETYDGSQLAPLRNYLKFGLSGSSCISWIGPCCVRPEFMVDGEDVRSESEIASDSMVHFIAELFHIDLIGAIAFQRLMAEIAREVIYSCGTNTGIFTSEQGRLILREGDDLFWEGRKLSISIATRSAGSCLVHFAVNVVRGGAPIPVSCLEELGVNPSSFAMNFLSRIEQEWDDMWFAYYKVRSF